MLMFERTDELDALIIDFAQACLAGAPRSAPRCRRRAARRSAPHWDVITDVPGVRVGHWTGAGTGVTVVCSRPGTVGSGEVRGGAPATRETALLDPSRTVEHVDAVVLAGGSAFGLATADGVMRALAEHGRGFPTRGGPVPIVPGGGDLRPRRASGGDAPGPDEGRAALADAAGRGRAVRSPLGRVGAGRGATRRQVARRRARRCRAGSGSASARDGDVVVGALAVVNAVGDVIGADGARARRLDRARRAARRSRSCTVRRRAHDAGASSPPNARCTKIECHLLAQSAHHGLARAIHPSHTRYDGDLAFAVATGDGRGDAIDRLRVLATEVTAEAIRAAVAYRPRDPDGRVARCRCSNHVRRRRSPSSSARRSRARSARWRRRAPRSCSASGDPHADLMFVGEGPGEQEDLQGEPFVGRAGQLLTSLIEGIGLTRDDVYIANVVKCRPPGNRDPQPVEIEACRPYLEAQLEFIDPAVVVTLGNFATKLLLDTKDGITKLRGREFPVPATARGAHPDAAPVGGAAQRRRRARRRRAPTSSSVKRALARAT